MPLEEEVLVIVAGEDVLVAGIVMDGGIVIPHHFSAAGQDVHFYGRGGLRKVLRCVHNENHTLLDGAAHGYIHHIDAGLEALRELGRAVVELISVLRVAVNQQTDFMACRHLVHAHDKGVAGFGKDARRIIQF